MMKKIVPCILWIACVSVCSGALGDADDGYLGEGEYDYFVEWRNYEQPLIVDGGGAEWIEVRDYGRIEVISTSTPLSNSSGIWDIALDDHSELLYLDGILEELTISEDATAVLKG